MNDHYARLTANAPWLTHCIPDKHTVVICHKDPSVSLNKWADEWMLPNTLPPNFAVVNDKLPSRISCPKIWLLTMHFGFVGKSVISSPAWSPVYMYMYIKVPRPYGLWSILCFTRDWNRRLCSVSRRRQANHTGVELGFPSLARTIV